VVWGDGWRSLKEDSPISLSNMVLEEKLKKIDEFLEKVVMRETS
jgi:hypothetical protein